MHVGVYDSGTDLRHDEFAGKPHSGVRLADPGCKSDTVLFEGCFFSEGDRSAVHVFEALPPEALLEVEEGIANGDFTREQVDDYLKNVGARYEWHGTFVAANVLANRNGAGAHGVAFGANVSALRRFSNTYQDGPGVRLYKVDAPAPEAVTTAYAQLHEQNVRVVNHSWGPSDPRRMRRHWTRDWTKPIQQTIKS